MGDIHRTTCLECGDSLSLDGSVGVTRMFNALEADHTRKTGHASFLHSVEPNPDDEPTIPHAIVGQR